MKKPTLAALLAVIPLLSGIAAADEAGITLRPGTGMDTTAANCAACHSLDYIVMNSPFLSADGWKAEVTKMRSAFAAPIDQAVADEILAYLSANYAAPPKP